MTLNQANNQLSKLLSKRNKHVNNLGWENQKAKDLNNAIALAEEIRKCASRMEYLNNEINNLEL